MSSTSALSKVFRGDHEDLVDHLIFASNEHKMRTQPAAGFGRDLVPFFTPGEELASLAPPTKNWQSCGSPPRSSKARKAVALPATASRCAIAVPVSGSRKPRASTDLPAVKVPRTRTCGGSSSGTLSTSPVSSASSIGTPHLLSSRSSFTSMGSSPPACPAFFSSPKPDALPMPTTGLLSRAGTIVHVERPIAAMRGFVIPTAAA